MYQTWLDVKYANLLSSKLKRFKIKSSSPYLANFRCPICGDSDKSKIKARGYIFQHKDRLFYRCHNCGAPPTFQNFLKRIDEGLYEEYIRERFLAQDEQPKPEKKKEPLEFAYPEYLKKGKPLAKLKKVSQLAHDHPVKQYVVKRKIPNFYHAKLFYAPKFAQWVNSIIPDKLDEKYDEPRLVIPFFDENKEMIGFQGRAFNPKSIRYITIMLKEDATKLYGLDTVDKSKTVYVLEGPIDSMFIQNSVAMAGSDVALPKDFCTVVYVFDNEPRNKEIVKRLDKKVKLGYSVCIWPSNIHEKDINDMVLSGMDSEDVQSIINANTYSGLMAQLKLTEWRKV